MVTLAHPSTFMFSRPMAGNGELDYPDLPQNHFSAAPMTSPYEPNMTTDVLHYPRQFGAGPVQQFDSETWMNQNYMFDGRQSPPSNNYDDANLTSSNLSSMSAPSPTSTAGSPPSQPGQLAGSPPAEWTAHGNMVVTPGIVGHGEYITGSDYSSYSGAMDEFQIDFAAVPQKAPGFVGESAQVSTSSVVATTAPTSGAIMSPVVAADVTPRAPSTVVFPGAAPSAEVSGLVSSSVLAGSKRRHASSGSISSHNPPPQTPLLSPYFAQGGSGYFTAPAQSPYPSLINQEMRPMGIPAQFDGAYGHPVSPALSPLPQNGAFMRSPSHSPPMAGFPYPPYASMEPMQQPQRPSPEYDGYAADDSKGGERQRCPHPDCGKTYKDIKAHMLTHQLERPEKCPIQSCEYHVKGFSRKYDRNRHTLTHYKGNMVCGFCPGSGSAVEKSFNRADVFKRHLTAVHNVEQTPPNSRKKGGPNGGAAKKLTGYAPDATGKCSTCSATFSNAQDFYEHLDDCVLRIVQLEDPAEAVNAQRLAEVEHDRDVHATLEKNQLPIKTETVSTEEDDAAGADDEDMVDEAEDGSDVDEEDASPGSVTKRGSIKTGPANGVQKSRGMTHSRRGQPVTGKARGRKGRREYPSSWGFDKGQMTMKKRVMTVFEGPRRLAKDDMMVSTEREVRLQLGDGKSYVTDLDVAILNRATGFQSATDEEKGLWLSDDPTEAQVKEMIEFSTRQEAAQTQTPDSTS